MKLRDAEPRDVVGIHALIRELAEYEKCGDCVTNTIEDLHCHLFEDQICRALVIEHNQAIIGFALYYVSYSTWKGKCIYLEDLYVQDKYRGSGYGLQLFNAVKEVARLGGYKRLDWQVLDWNEPAIEFYKRQGALLDPEWINGRLYLD
jgi:GNAT superfamily N-acetyltransferase